MKSKVGERGQVTIPIELRRRLGIRPGQVVEFREEEGRLILRKQVSAHPVDRVFGILSLDASTDELMSLLRGDGEDG